MVSTVEKLKNCKTRFDLLNILFPHEGSKMKYLEVIFHSPSSDHYSSFSIPKKSGGERIINAPKKELAVIQKRLTNLLENCFEELLEKPNTYSNAFLKNKSIITNAEKHRNKNLILNTDLEDFFPSITFGRVRNYFMKNKNFNLSEDVSTMIAKIACYKNALPQGSPCSPIISNFIGQILDIRLGKLASKYQCHYSRYADDITFSTNLSKFDKKLLVVGAGGVHLGKEIEKVILDSGFKVNSSKTRLFDKREKQIVTGLITNQKINVSRKYFDDTKAMARFYYKNGYFEIDGKKGNAKQLLGRFNFINQLEKYNNKLFFKKNEKTQPHVLVKDENHPIETQSDMETAPIQLTKNSKFHTFKTKAKGEINFRYSIDGKFYKYNKPLSNGETDFGYSVGYGYLSSRERKYSEFLYYNNFINNDEPVVLTEGETDVLYLKFALKNLHQSYKLIVKNNGKFSFKIKFFKFSKLKHYLLNIYPGIRGVVHLLNPAYLFPEKDFIVSNAPIILIIDNEKDRKPLSEFMKNDSFKSNINNNNFSPINSSTVNKNNSYVSKDLLDRISEYPNKFNILVIPPKTKTNTVSNKQVVIEDLFDEYYLESVGYNRKKSKKGKGYLSKRVFKDYKDINFQGFEPLLDALNKIVG